MERLKGKDTKYAVRVDKEEPLKPLQYLALVKGSHPNPK
jgi:hypothetical protein